MINIVGTIVKFRYHMEDSFRFWIRIVYINFFVMQSRMIKSTSSEILLYLSSLDTKLYYYMRNVCNLIGLEQLYFSLI